MPQTDTKTSDDGVGHTDLHRKPHDRNLSQGKLFFEFKPS